MRISRLISFDSAHLSRALLLLASGALLAGASPLLISTSGSFSATDTATHLVQPGATWSLRFTTDSMPIVDNPGADGFNDPFTDFVYSVNGNLVVAAPASIRFFGTSSGGLFTIFFGPQTGMDSNGAPIPELTLSGPQLYSGSTSSPVLATSSYAVSEFLFTDGAGNYDDQLTPGSSVRIAATATPEPASLAMLATGCGFLLLVWISGRRSSTPSVSPDAYVGNPHGA